MTCSSYQTKHSLYKILTFSDEYLVRTNSKCLLQRPQQVIKAYLMTDDDDDDDAY